MQILSGHYILLTLHGREKPVTANTNIQRQSIIPTKNMSDLKPHTSVLFVCLGNICRSPAAEEIMREVVRRNGCEDRFTLDSAGLYGGHAGDLPDRRMRVHAFQRGYSLLHRSRQVRRSDFSDFDIIVAMDDSNYQRLRSMAATIEEEDKIVRMIDYVTDRRHCDCIPDPYYEGAEGFELVLDLLEDGCQNLYDTAVSASNKD